MHFIIYLLFILGGVLSFNLSNGVIGAALALAVLGWFAVRIIVNEAWGPPEGLEIPRMPLRMVLVSVINPRRFAEEALVNTDAALTALERWDAIHAGADESDAAVHRKDALVYVGDLLGAVEAECRKHAELRVVYSHVVARYRGFSMW